MRRLLVAFFALAVSASGAVLPSAEAAAYRLTVAGTFEPVGYAAAPIQGETYKLRGSLPPQMSRPIVLERFVDGQWNSLVNARSRSDGTFVFTREATERPGTSLRLRVRGPATTLNGSRYPALTTPELTIRVTRPVAALTAPELGEVLQRTPVDVRVTPARAGRTIVLQTLDGDQWRAVGEGTERSNGQASFVYRPDVSGPHRLRAVVRPFNGGRGTTSPGVTVGATTWTSVQGTTGLAFCGLVASGQGVCDQFPSGLVASPLPWADIRSGYEYTCGVRSDGSGWCWGHNSFGRFGNGEASNNWDSVPSRIAGDGAWAQISPASIHTCGVKTDHTLWCWGDDRSGQVGDGTVGGPYQLVPFRVGAEADWATVETGDTHTCATKISGGLWCWGGNLTSSAQTFPATPTQQAPAAIATSGGNRHMCAIGGDQSLWCMGDNGYGQLGTGDSDVRYQLAKVGTATDWEAVSAGNITTCGIRAGGYAWCWGAHPGNGTSGTQVPVKLTGRWTEVVANGGGACGVRIDGSAWCWGQLGPGSPEIALTPVRLELSRLLTGEDLWQ